MGEIADGIIDRMMFGSGRNQRPRQTFQAGSGNYMWRTSDGQTVSMHSMTVDHLTNAIALCERSGNSGKAVQLLTILAERAS